MTRSRLRNRFLKDRIEENRKLFCKQRNKRVSFLRKSKKDYFANLNEKTIPDNKRFWKTVKRFLSKKIHPSGRINLTEEENKFNCEEGAKELNNFFANAVKNLNMSNYENCNSLTKTIDDATFTAIDKWRNHPSILIIASEYKNRTDFSFHLVSKEDALTEIKLDVSKAIQESDIPVKIIKANFFAEAICFCFNKSLKNGK